MTLFFENNPICARKIAIVERPPMPLVIQANHQEAFPQLGAGIISPFEFSYCRILISYCVNGLRKGQGSLRRLGDWAVGCIGVLFHSGNSLLNLDWISCSIKARWLMSSFVQSRRIIELWSIDNLKLVGVLIAGIVAQNALRVKGGPCQT